jgi:hypothetical protein
MVAEIDMRGSWGSDAHGVVSRSLARGRVHQRVKRRGFEMTRKAADFLTIP